MDFFSDINPKLNSRLETETLQPMGTEPMMTQQLQRNSRPTIFELSFATLRRYIALDSTSTQAALGRSGICSRSIHHFPLLPRREKLSLANKVTIQEEKVLLLGTAVDLNFRFR